MGVKYTAFVPKHPQYVPHINTLAAVPEITVAALIRI